MMSAARAITPRVVLVTDGEQRAALACVRSLGTAGHRVIVASPRERSLAGASRFAAIHTRAPDALTHPDEFLATLSEIVREQQVDVVLPITEQSLLPVLGARQKFPNVTIPFATLDQFERISNKAEVTRLAKSLGIAVPVQHTLSGPDEQRALDLTRVSYPVVVKPARSVVSVDGERMKVGVSYAAGARELADRLNAYPPDAYPLLIQQRIVGPGIGVFLLVWGGATIAACGHRRIREVPPSGGVSVYREAVTPPDSLVTQSRALLDQFGWQGVAMIEYKMEAESEVPYLMEVNARFWGSLQLAIDAGVDFPNLLMESALGERRQISQRSTIRDGVRSRWEWGEVNHLVARLRRTNDQLALPPGAPSRGRAILDFFHWKRGDRPEVFRAADPGPFVRETVDWFRRR